MTDQSTYTDQVSLRVPSAIGYSYEVLLDGQRIPTDQSVTVARMDYHELSVTRTNIATLDITNRLIRFIVLSSNRGNPEKGLMEWKPYPTITSAAAEFTGAQLHVMAPADYPRGLRIPVIAWVDDGADRIRRANGDVAAAGFEGQDLRIRRGHGSTTLNPAIAGGELAYSARLYSLEANKVINVEDSTTWTQVSGTLGGNTTWPQNSRIHLTGNVTVPVDATLTIEAGTIIQANALVNINVQTGARMIINGTADRPVVLTAMGPVAPHQRTYAWGGFLVRGPGATLQANHAIFVGGGGAASFNFGEGDSHRPEQAVLLVHSNALAALTNCAIINTAGQVGNAYKSDLTYDHCLIQKAITCGEHVDGTIIVNKSALIEFPEENGSFSATISDADYDDIYFTTGTHLILDSLFGWAKDDAIDSGSGGAGTVLVTNCWIESALHEALAWSGNGRQTWTYDTVLMNSGQGIECGWSSGTGSPNCFADRLLSIGNSVGARFGDNYDWDYWGRLRVTNSLILHNYRDIWGMNWENWRYGIDSGDNTTFAMNLQGNYVTSANTNHPNNPLWDPTADGWRLAHWMTTPANAPVGLGLAVWTNEFGMTDVFEGVPVRLSSFTTNAVSVAYEWANQEGYLAGGTLRFAPGETVKRIYMSPGVLTTQNSLHLTLANPAGAELTGLTNVLFQGSLAVPQVGLAVSTNTLPSYRLPEGVFVRLSSPAVRQVVVTYAFESHTGQVLETGTNVFAPGETWKLIYLQKANPFNYESVRLALGNADGATFGGTTSVTFSNPVLAVSFAGSASQYDLGSLTNGLAFGLNSPAAAAVSVAFTLEGAEGVLTNGVATIAAGQTVVAVPVPSVDPQAYTFLRASLGSPVGAILGSPSVVYYLTVPAPTNTVLVANNAVWRYRVDASAAPAAWNTLGFDDSTWPSGPAQLGFGESDQATTIPNNGQLTSYFRHALVVADPGAYTNLALRLIRDDGGVVYFNGTEVFRSPNMPRGLISYSTLTVGTNGENTLDLANVSPGVLVAGTNVVAVEIHQAAPDSSDVSFALELVGHGAPPPPTPQQLRMAQFGGDQQLNLGWAGTGFVLQEATSVTGPWTNVVAPSPVTVPVNPAVPQRFYRIWKP